MSFTEGGKENFVKINDFLAQLKTIVDEMSEQELRVWLYDYARRLSEEAREPFLQGLLELEVEEAFVQEEIDQKMLWASDWLDEVEEGKKIIYYIQDDDINDWDYDYEPGDEYEGIEDPDNVLKEFTQVLEIIDYIVNASQFEDAEELLGRLFQMQMRAPIIWKYDGTEIDEDFVHIPDLFDAMAFDIDYYSRLWLYVIAELPTGLNFNRLFKAMKKLNITDIDVIQTVGPYEINPAVFIDEWIAFLAKTKGDDAYKLLMEAYRMYKTADYIEDNLADYGQTHPLLFLDVLSKKLSLEFMDAEFDASALKTRIQELSGKQLEEIKNIVKLAESLIPKDLTIGAEMMEVGFEISVRENNETKATHFRKQAFYYHSSIVNYLRLRAYLNKDELLQYSEYWRKRPKKEKYGFRSFSIFKNADGLTHNTLGSEQLEAQLFFTEQFTEFFNHCKERQTSLGWSNSTLGFGVPLFLLLLNKNPVSSQAMEWMEGYVVERLIDTKRDRHYFSEMFNQFKYSVNLSEELEKEIIQWLDQRISERTEALLDNKYRNAYYRSTELIIAYGEVLESRGETNARARTAENYRKKYNNFNRFTRELKKRL